MSWGPTYVSARDDSGGHAGPPLQESTRGVIDTQHADSFGGRDSETDLRTVGRESLTAQDKIKINTAFTSFCLRKNAKIRWNSMEALGLPGNGFVLPFFIFSAIGCGLVPPPGTPPSQKLGCATRRTAVPSACDAVWFGAGFEPRLIESDGFIHIGERTRLYHRNGIDFAEDGNGRAGTHSAAAGWVTGPFIA